MEFIDTHAHIYMQDLDTEIDIVIKESAEKHVTKILVPHVDSESTSNLLAVCKKYPTICFPMMGLHPTSVKENYEEELTNIERQLANNKFIAIGEIGIDLYWDKTFYNQQAIAFLHQLDLAKKYNLPVAIHTRSSFPETIALLEQKHDSSLKGVFHCFSGNLQEAYKTIEMGYKLGIGGVVTFKNSDLAGIVKEIDLEHLVLETDAPFLTPHPHRGKRNDPSYIPLIAQKVAEIKNVSLEEVSEVTTKTTLSIFPFKLFE